MEKKRKKATFENCIGHALSHAEYMIIKIAEKRQRF